MGYESTVLARSPISYWRFGEASGDAVDEMGVNNLSNSGMIYSQTGTPDVDDGDTCYKYRDSVVASSLTTGIASYINKSVLTIEMYFKLDSGTAGSINTLLWNWYYRTSTTGAYYIRVEYNNLIRFYINTNDGVLDLSASYTFSTGTWYYLVCEYKAGGAKIYINDVLVASDAKGSLIPSYVGGRLIVGCDWVSSGDSYALTGWIDELAIYGTAWYTVEDSTLRPKFRFYSSGTGFDTLTFGASKAISFPNQLRPSYYTIVEDLPKYTYNIRKVASVNLDWQVENLNKTNRDVVFDFWDTSLSDGRDCFSIIDHRKRLLFDVCWDQWHERWKKARGGLYSISMSLHSPYDWSPPCFAAYLMSDESLDDYCLDTSSNLTAVDGTIVNHGSDSAVLREIGGALRITNGSPIPTGAQSGTMSWIKQKSNDSMTIFLQFRFDTLKYGSHTVTLLHLTDTTTNNYIKIDADRLNASDNYNITLRFKKAGQSEETISVSPDMGEITHNIWHDIAVTFDLINNKAHLYHFLSANGATWSATNDFLNGYAGVAIINGIKTANISNFPSVTWTNLYLMQCESTTPFNADSTYGYVQNIFLFDEFLSPYEFNNLRRLCHLWNKKTERAPV